MYRCSINLHEVLAFFLGSYVTQRVDQDSYLAHDESSFVRPETRGYKALVASMATNIIPDVTADF